MDWLRKKVSGKRNRTKCSGFDLDISYVTDRVLAMSFPASGWEKAYRNPIEEVPLPRAMPPCRLRVFSRNGTNKTTSSSTSATARTTTASSATRCARHTLTSQVRTYQWEDHHSPPMHVLFESVLAMYEFLKKDKRNVVVVHCNAGKGRTGTSIACLLMFAGRAARARPLQA